MRKCAKILLAISCLLPLTCLIAFAEEVKLPNGDLVDVNPYYGIDAVGCPLDEYGNPLKDYYYYFYPEPTYNEPDNADLEPIEIDGYEFSRYCVAKGAYYSSYFSSYTVELRYFEDAVIGDKIVFFDSDQQPYIMTVVDIDDRLVYVTSDTGLTENLPFQSYTFQIFVVKSPPLIEQVSAWIIGCFSTVGFVLGSFAEGNEIVTFFLLVIPLSGLIFAFVKSLIYRR